MPIKLKLFVAGNVVARGPVMQRIGSARPAPAGEPTPPAKSGSQLYTKPGSQLSKPKQGSQVVKAGSQLKTVAAAPKKVIIGASLPPP